MRGLKRKVAKYIVIKLRRDRVRDLDLDKNGILDPKKPRRRKRNISTNRKNIVEVDHPPPVAVISLAIVSVLKIGRSTLIEADLAIKNTGNIRMNTDQNSGLLTGKCQLKFQCPISLQKSPCLKCLANEEKSRDHVPP